MDRNITLHLTQEKSVWPFAAQLFKCQCSLRVYIVQHFLNAEPLMLFFFSMPELRTIVLCMVLYSKFIFCINTIILLILTGQTHMVHAKSILLKCVQYIIIIHINFLPTKTALSCVKIVHTTAKLHNTLLYCLA